MWASLSLSKYIRSIRDSNWLIFDASWPTNDRLSRFGMRVDPYCVCGTYGTLHLLWLECPTYKPIRDWFLSFFKLFDRALDRSTHHLEPGVILFGFQDSHIPSGGSRRESE